MHGKRIIAVILLNVIILGILPCNRANAVAPAIPVAVYYAIGATMTAGGLYAASDSNLESAITDYYNSQSAQVKKRWAYTAATAESLGKIVVDSDLVQNVISFVKDVYVTGDNTVSVEAPVAQVGYYSSFCSADGSRYTYDVDYTGVAVDERVRPDKGGVNVYCDGVFQDFYEFYFAQNQRYATIPCVKGWGWCEKHQRYCLQYEFYQYKDGYPDNPVYTDGCPVNVPANNFCTAYKEKVIYVGDSAGFGVALVPEQEVQVPCPPLPPAEWPDNWIDDLERDLNNTTADRYVETMDEDYDWYVDEDGHIYKKPKGEPPEKDDDTKLVPPIPPPYQPVHPEPGQPGPATPDQPWVPAEPCPYCPSEPGPGPSCPNPYCPNHPQPQTPPQYDPSVPPAPCPYCPSNPDPATNPCPNPYCPYNPQPEPAPNRPEQPVPDDRYIDLEPLKKLPGIFTQKFPFSLPWDLKRGIESLKGDEWDRKFRIAACGDFWPEMVIDVSMFDPIADITRVIFLIIFDFGLIFATRRLMGGDV